MIASELLEKLEAVKCDEQLFDLGFKCIGLIDENYPDIPESYLEDYYRTWIWENADGLRVATWDEGNTWCHFICEGSKEALLDYFNQE